MSYMIASEHFELTPTIRENVAKIVTKATTPLSGDARVRVHLKRSGPDAFTVTLRVTDHGNEWVTHGEDSRFYVAVSAAAVKLARSIHETTQARARSRRQGHRRAEPPRVSAG
jgi:ribosome-associated translation inhibitor RaiA